MSKKTKSKNVRILSLATTGITDADLTDTKFEILRKGEFYDERYGDFEITDKKIKALKKNFDSNVRGVDIAVDVNHDSFSGAVAWVDELFLEGGKLMMTLKDVTEEGKKILKEKVYKYFSVEFGPFDKVTEGKVQTIHDVLAGVALTNRPVIKGMSPTFMSEDAVNRKSDMLKPVKLFADSLIKKDSVSKDDKDLFKAMLEELPEEEKEELKDEAEKVEEKPEEKPADPEPKKDEEEEDPDKKPKDGEGEGAGDDEGKKDLAETNVELTEAKGKIAKLEASEAERLTKDRTSEMTLSEKCKVGFPKTVSVDLNKFIKSLSEAQYEGFKALVPKVATVTEAMLKEMGDEGEVGTATATAEKVVELAEKKLKANPEMDVTTAQKEAAEELGFDPTK